MGRLPCLGLRANLHPRQRVTSLPNAVTGLGPGAGHAATRPDTRPSLQLGHGDT